MTNVELFLLPEQRAEDREEQLLLKSILLVCSVIIMGNSLFNITAKIKEKSSQSLLI